MAISKITSQNLQNLEAVPYQSRLAFLLGAISNLTTTTGSRAFRRAFGLGLGEVRLMYVLNYEGPLTAQHASRIIGVNKGAMSRTVAALEHRGIVCTRINTFDARERVIDFSPAGRKLVEQVMALALERERRLYSALTAEEFRALSSLLQKLRKSLLAIPEPASTRGAANQLAKLGGQRVAAKPERKTRLKTS